MVERRVLVLGGTRFAGPALVAAAVASGAEVTTFHRGTRPAVPAARQVLGDRRDRTALEQLRSEEWDLVVDTWSGAPRTALLSAEVLADVAARVVVVSSRSVHSWPTPAGAPETAALVSASAEAHATTYGADKRGAELAWHRHFAGRCLLLRPGLLLGPGELDGRLAHWLRRMADPPGTGGTVLAPGPPATPLQHIDVRDLAAWAVGPAAAALDGAVNVATRTGATTMERLLHACREVAGPAARLRWVDGLTLARAGLMGWTDLPIWSPPGTPQHDALHGGDVELAIAHGLTTRSIESTVADTWGWLRETPADRASVQTPGLDRARERAFLAGLGTA